MRTNKRPYPENILFDIFLGEEKTSYQNFAENADLMKGLEYALSTLKEQEQTVLRLYFAEGNKLREVGEELGVSVERVRQVKAIALRKLRKKTRSCFVLDGYEGTLEKRRALAEEKLKELEARHQSLVSNTRAVGELCVSEITDLLDIRTTNVLRRAFGLNMTLGELDNMSDEELSRVRNLGRNSLSCIRKAIETLKNDYGVTEKLTSEAYIQKKAVRQSKE